MAVINLYNRGESQASEAVTKPLPTSVKALAGIFVVLGLVIVGKLCSMDIRLPSLTLDFQVSSHGELASGVGARSTLRPKTSEATSRKLP
jgi:hypothetical protein